MDVPGGEIDDALRDLPRLLEAISRQLTDRGAASPFSERDHATARTLADHVVRARRDSDRVRILLEAIDAFSSASGGYQELLVVVARELGKAVGGACGIRAVARDGLWLETTGGVYHPDPSLHDAMMTLLAMPQRVGDGLSGSAAASGKPVLIAHVDMSQFVAAAAPLYRDLLERIAITSTIVMPLVCSGQVVGVANLLRSRPAAPYDESDVVFVQSIATHAAFAIAHARSHEAELAAKSHFAQLFESSIIGMIRSDVDGRVLDVNQALLAMVGSDRDEVLSGRINWLDLTADEWRSSDTQAIAVLRATGVSGLREKEYVHRDGHRVPVLVGSVMLTGEPVCVSFVVDLTERNAAQTAIDQLRHQHAIDLTFRDLLDAAPDAMVIAGAGGEITIVNSRVERLFGYTRVKVIGGPLELLIPDLDKGGEHAPNGVARELVGRRENGALFPIEVSSSRLATEDGVLVSHAIRDISDRKHADRQQAQLAAIVDASADAIIGNALDGTVTSWNSGAEAIFGYSAAEMVGRSLAILIPAARSAEEPLVLETLARGEIMRFDTVRCHRSGREIDVSVAISPIRDREGRVIGISRSARDITDRKRDELALATAKNAAEAANTELEAFSYSVAHDLRAPLRGMNGFARLLVETYAERFDAAGRDWLDEILRNATRMGELIDALLSLARVARAELIREPVNLSALVRALVTELASAEPARRVELVIRTEVWVQMDPRLARILVDNLVRNAWKFTSKRAAASIELGLDPARRAFYLRDDGVGFDMAFVGKLFGAFQRLHGRAEFPGTGIGLATVHRIVHRHGGRIWAEGHVDAGATFFVTLPDLITPELP